MVYFITFYIKNNNWVLRHSAYTGKEYAYGATCFVLLQEAMDVFKDYHNIIRDGDPKDPFVIKQMQRIHALHPSIIGLEGETKQVYKKLSEYITDKRLFKTNVDLLNVPNSLYKMSPDFMKFEVLNVADWLLNGKDFSKNDDLIKVLKMAIMPNLNLN